MAPPECGLLFPFVLVFGQALSIGRGNNAATLCGRRGRASLNPATPLQELGDRVGHVFYEMSERGQPTTRGLHHAYLPGRVEFLRELRKEPQFYAAVSRLLPLIIIAFVVLAIIVFVLAIIALGVLLGTSRGRWQQRKQIVPSVAASAPGAAMTIENDQPLR